MIIWIIGLSGSGKSTLASKTIAHIKEKHTNVVLLDGDIVRETFGNDLGHSLVDRKKNSEGICRLWKLLDDLNIHVVCAVLSLFQEDRDWNRENFSNYHEVFIDVDIQTLQERDPKGYYAKFQKGEISDIPGLDMEFKRPVGSNTIIKNTQAKSELLKHAKDLASLLPGEN